MKSRFIQKCIGFIQKEDTMEEICVHYTKGYCPFFNTVCDDIIAEENNPWAENKIISTQGIIKGIKILGELYEKK